MTLENNSSIRIIKFGGSLFDLADWPERMEKFWNELRPMTTIMIVGGGELVEVLRREHAKNPSYTDKVMHKAAIVCMDIQSELFCDRWPRAILCRNEQPFDQWMKKLEASDEALQKNVIVAHMSDWMSPMISASRVRGIPIPNESWSVTSDSLAAWLAQVVSARELILLKSCSLESAGCDRDDLQTWSARGYVDPDFCNWAKTIPIVRAVNFRE
jgi:5-(aminomethyl)-3-furanmethanol phosphate kinase